MAHPAGGDPVRPLAAFCGARRAGALLAQISGSPSTGAVGSSYDNALAESVIGLCQTELIEPRRP